MLRLYGFKVRLQGPRGSKLRFRALWQGIPGGLWTGVEGSGFTVGPFF